MNTLTSRLLALLLAASVQAADAPKPAAPKTPEPATYLTVETAGPDFPLQGEYANEKFGADIIALGDGNFRMVLHKGGLPGSGWDGSAKVEVEAKRDGDKVIFQDKVDSAILENGVLTIKSLGQGLKRIVRRSPTEGLAAPKDAVILFDGKNADAWVNGHMDERNFLAAGVKSKQAFKDFSSSSSCPSSPSAVARVAPTAASTSRIATRFRYSIVSASRASIMSAAPSIRTAPPK